MSKQTATSEQTGLLSLGAFIIIVALSLLAFSIGVITRFDEMLALIIGFYGVWMIALALMRAVKPKRYGRSPFSVFAWGLLTTTIGYVWYLNIRGVPTLQVLAILLLVIGAVTIAASLKGTQKRR